MLERGKDIGCSVTEWDKKNTLKWCCHVKRMHYDRWVKKIHKSKVEGNRPRGRQLASGEEKVRKYIGERIQGGVMRDEAR